MKSMPSTPPVKLILHFDINKTIIISDPVSGVETDAMINALLSECSWGIVAKQDDEEELTPRSWRLIHPHPSSSPLSLPPPASCSPPSPSSPSPHPPILTYNEFLENVLKPEKAYKKRMKAIFTEPGQLGEPLRPYFHRIQAALRLSDEDKARIAEWSNHQHDGGGEGFMEKLRASGQYYILPSFFRLINHLEEEEQKKDEKEKRFVGFNLIFRTFGIDLPHVAEEWNLFCRNHHPLYLPSRPHQTVHRAIVLPRDSAAIYRTSLDVTQGLHLAAVTPTQLVTVTHGMKAVYERMMQKLQEEGEGEGRQTLALQDDYAWWAKNHESNESGKILLIERPPIIANMPSSSSATASTALRQPLLHHHHIFFDDNIERDRSHIVDVRDLATGEPLPYHGYTKGRHLIKVEPLEAILNPKYFNELLHRALALSPWLDQSIPLT